jgi:hypothetical protein
MTIIEALKTGKIRYSEGKYFDATTRPGAYIGAENEAELKQIVADNAAKYVGSVFVRFDESLPAGVPTNTPAHCWAEPTMIGGQYVGATITWSTDEKESAHRASKPRTESFDEFNVRRHGNE